MPTTEPWQEQIAKALSWGEAHTSLDAAVDKLDAATRARRPDGAPHSVWELVDHIRITQHDLLDFCRNPSYVHLAWPDEYWPTAPAPSSEQAWQDALGQIRADRDALAALARDPNIDLTSAIPHGEGQTYLRELLLAIDHTSYHVGEIVSVRQALGAWPPA